MGDGRWANYGSYVCFELTAMSCLYSIYSSIFGNISDALPFKKWSVIEEVNGVSSTLISIIVAPFDLAVKGISAAG